MEVVFSTAAELSFPKSAVGSSLPTGWSPGWLVAMEDFALLYSSLFPQTEPTLLFSPYPRCSVPQKAASPQLPCLLALDSDDKPWQEMGVKKEKSWGSPPARLWFGSGYVLLLQAALVSGGPSLMLIATSSPCALVPVGLNHMDYISGFSQPLASTGGVTEQHCRALDRGQTARSWFSFSQQLPPIALWADI